MAIKEYKNAIVPAGGRIYTIADADGGYKSITDNTNYTQVGSSFGASDIIDIGFIEHSHTKTGTVHALVSPNSATNIRFVATDEFSSGDTFTVNGVACTVKLQGTTDQPSDGFFSEGDVVTCFKNGTVLNFKSGGAGLNFSFKAYPTEAALLANSPNNGTIGVATGVQGNLIVNGITSQTLAGITFTKNPDGSITLNGTASAITYLEIMNNPPLVAGKTYTTGKTQNAQVALYVNELATDGSSIPHGIARLTDTTWAFDGIAKTTNTLHFSIVVERGAVLSNYIVYPVLVEGQTIPTAAAPINGYAFVASTSEITSPVTGMVAITEGTSSTASFNALKKNTLTVYPIACYRYSGSAWQTKAFYVRKGGAWVH